MNAKQKIQEFPAVTKLSGYKYLAGITVEGERKQSVTVVVVVPKPFSRAIYGAARMEMRRAGLSGTPFRVYATANCYSGSYDFVQIRANGDVYHGDV